MENPEILNKIAEALLMDYTSVYYVNTVTNEYFWYSVDPNFHSLQIEPKGDDFFVNIIRDAKQVIYEEDLHIFTEDLTKEKLLANVKKGSMQQIEYRLMIDGKPVYHALRLIRGTGDTDDYFVLGVLNIDKEYRMRQKALRMEKEKEVFNRVAEGLALHYDKVFYIDIETGNYTELVGKESLKGLLGPISGEDFFVSLMERWNRVGYEEDRERIASVLSKDYLLYVLTRQKMYVTVFRFYDENRVVHHCRGSVVLSNDKTHFIVGFDYIDEEAKKEKKHVLELKMANEMARRDDLTGIKNKTAYHEYEDALIKDMMGGICDPFALVVCDINDLKLINDKSGHQAGDEYIRSSARMICKVFAHSPVFRIGGDEFVVILHGEDYYERDDLVNEFQTRVTENINEGDGPIVASGMAEYNKETDRKVTDVFERADALMYENKTSLKEQKILKDTFRSRNDDIMLIPEERKRKVDALFKAISIVADGSYVFLCDMKYDFSRWSKIAVDTFGLPSEYMYHAGDIWEDYIHPDDRNSYHAGISEIFVGGASGHDMQYRARKLNGEYDVCTCRGFVLKDKNGEPEYFAGSIRNHGLQSNVDSLTGLRNQYGFFEDLQNYMNNKKAVNVCMVGINKFSEINEVYGYSFGNLVLQKFARYIFEFVGNNGVVYRMDGTRFIIVSSVLSTREVMVEYEKFRHHFRGEFYVQDRCLSLELSAGTIYANNFDIDYQTVYACLSFAYDESKRRKKGDLIEFYNDLNSENRSRIEKLQAIRASITHDYAGFYLLYQPVIDAVTEKVVGSEALLRWKNDTYGVVPPNHFIPLLEVDALFPSLGKWILKTAMTDSKKMLEINPDFLVHINLSYTQLEKPDFVDMIAGLLEETGFPADHLVLEITERCRLLDLDLLKNIVVNLRGRGVLIALDDFGTGFSSIGIIKNLHFDIIKIDRSFVLRIEEDLSERELMKHFTAIASTFHADVCVEGVETAGMRDILKNYPVQSFQGYFYAKPIPLEELKVFKTE